MQVLLDTKTVMRSMRTGGEDFDAAYNSVILDSQNWRDALGATIVPAIVTASRQNVSRRDFSEYDFASSASLVRFVANTVDRFEEIPLGLSVSRAAFLDVILACFPALIAACYHYLAGQPAQHVHNRDSFLVRFAPVPAPACARFCVGRAMSLTASSVPGECTALVTVRAMSAK